ncbi:sigma-54-dependent Fis family transcriptional regulator [bacterium]|jgi:DNA-binding NtrC family response regulator|nr:sigma-54-dependent Fis family transcriptional regulator [bacterium]
MKILLVEDEKITRITIEDALKSEQYEVKSCGTGQEALSLLDNTYDLVLTDIRMPGISGTDLLHEVKSKYPEIEVILMTAYSTVENAVDALKAGAYDYMTKPFSNTELLVIVKRLETFKRIASENVQLRREVSGNIGGKLVGSSVGMIGLKDKIKAIAPGDFTVLIKGESGTGKELVAEAIHKASPRKDEPFVRVSCAALSESVLESELYGHEEGSFTGAIRRHIGRFERSSGGTIFLDDIDDFPLPLQVKLLRTLQEKEIERVGGTATVKVDLRVVAATKVDLRQLVEKGSFREDLFYRLNIVPLTIPPLRERDNDIDILVEHFIVKHSSGAEMTVASEVFDALNKWHWPGNVRELENCVVRMVALATGTSITVDDIPEEYIAGANSWSSPVGEIDQRADAVDFNNIVDEFQIKLLKWAQNQSGDNISKAARLLGLSRSTFRSKLIKFGLDAGEKSLK